MKLKHFVALVLAFVAMDVFSQSMYELYNVGQSVRTKQSEPSEVKTTTISDTVEVRFITNVPANLKLNGVDYGEVSVNPYRLKYGQYKVELSADGYRTQKKNIEPSRTQLSIYDIKLRKDNSYPYRKGIQQEVALDFGFGEGEILSWSNRWNFLADYVIGYRFNNWVYLGAGTGLHIYNHVIAREDGWNSNNSYKTFIYGEYKYVGDDHPNFYHGHDITKLSTSAEIPLYAQLKIYFMDTRWKPFFLTSVGGRFGLNKYKDTGALFNCGLGVEYCLTEHYAINLSMGYQMKGQKYSRADRNVDYRSYSSYGCLSSCPYYKSYHYHFNVVDEVKTSSELIHGFFLRAGFVF